MKKLILGFMLLLPLCGYAQFDDKFYYPHKEWQEHNLPDFEDLWVADGTDSVYAVWCKPQGDIKAVIFYCHGNQGNISYNDVIIRPLVENGFAVFAWEYPGYGYSNGTPTHAAIARMGQLSLDKMIEREEREDKPVIVYGLSIGAQVATKLARDNRDKVSALVVDSGIKSFTDMAMLFTPEEMHPMIRQIIVSPYSVIEDITYLDGMPKLILHSPEDQTAPFSHAEEVFAAAPEPKRFFDYPGGHVKAFATKQEEVIGLLEKLVE